MRPLTLLGIDFSRAPIGLREDLSFTGPQSQDFYSGFARPPDVELLILSTCNRTEFYLAAQEPEAAEAQLMLALRRLRPAAKALDGACSRYRCTGAPAVRHMMTVATGLQSQVRGDPHIAQQLRQAAELAVAAGSAGPALQAAAQASLLAAKRVRSETGIGSGAASTGAAVLGAIRNRFGSCETLRLLLAGSGQAAGDVAIHLAKQRFAAIQYTARRLERSQLLAATHGGVAIPWSGAAQAASQADVIIAAVSSPISWLGSHSLALQRAGKISPATLLIVDLGVPRNADPDCAHLDGVSILNIDQIQRELAGTLAARESNVAEAERIVDEEVARYERRLRRQTVEPAIRELYRQAGEIRDCLLNGQRRETGEMLRLMMKRLLDGPVRRLRGLAATDETGAALAAAVLSPSQSARFDPVKKL